MMKSEPLPSSAGPRSTRIELDADHVVDVAMADGGAVLSLASRLHGHSVDVEIAFHSSGPVVRVRAPRVEIESETWNVECEQFKLHAKSSIEMTTEGAAEVSARRVGIDASPGAIRLRANDDVQLLGEKVLLNCERMPPMPPWVPQPWMQPASLPPSPSSGDDGVVAEMLDAVEADATRQ